MERMTKFRVGVFLVLVAAMVFFFGLRAYNVQVVNATVSDNSISTDKSAESKVQFFCRIII